MNVLDPADKVQSKTEVLSHTIQESFPKPVLGDEGSNAWIKMKGLLIEILAVVTSTAASPSVHILTSSTIASHSCQLQ
jgi:hypothetical protein